MTPDRDDAWATRAQWNLVAIVVALTVGVVVYRLTPGAGLSETSAFFVGLPAVLAVTVALSPRAKTARGVTFKALTFGLLLAGVLVGEGFVCIVMAAPLFYAIALPIAAVIQRNRDNGAPPGRVFGFVLAPVLLLSLEGTTGATTLPVENRVAASAVVAASATGVEAALAATPDFRQALPAFLRDAHFPRPLRAEGSGLEVGDVRDVLLSGPHGPAPLVLRVTERAPGRVVFGVELDATPLAGWMTIRRAVVTWSEIGTDRTQVRWELEFDRVLSPAFYFAPLERYGARQAAGYLIRTVATPRA